MKEKLLYCISPYAALTRKAAYNEVPLGSAIVKGVLDKGDFDVEAVDLNSLLNEHRSASPLLTQDDFTILSNPYLTKLYMDMELDRSDYNTKISDVIDWIMGLLPHGPYSWIAFSLNQGRPQNFHYDIMVLNFTWLLSRRLKDITGAKVVWGGAIFDYFTNRMQTECFRHMTTKDVDCIHFGEVSSSLLKILKSARKSHKIRIVGGKKLMSLWNIAVDVLSQNALMSSLTKKYKILKKSKRYPLQQTYLEKLRSVPSFNMKQHGPYAINIEKTFKVIKFLNLRNDISLKADIPIYPYMFMKGCLNNCAFCVSGASGFTALSPQEAVDGIERIMEENPGAKYFRFINSQINFSNTFALSFADEIIRRKIKIYFTDSANFRNNSGDVFEALRKAGCVKLWVGAESLSPKLLKLVGKNLSAEDIYKGIDIIHGSGIWLGVNMISGLPFEDDEDHAHNVAFMKTMKDKVNAWRIGAFVLPNFSRFYIYRNFFNLLPGKVYYPGGSCCTFSEKGARSWGQIKNDTTERLGELRSLISPCYNAIANNDRLLFYCYDHLGYAKNEAFRFINDYYAAVRNDEDFLKTIGVYPAAVKP